MLALVKKKQTNPKLFILIEDLSYKVRQVILCSPPSGIQHIYLLPTGWRGGTGLFLKGVGVRSVATLTAPLCIH